MSGVEIVAGGFASAAIRKFVNAAGGYLSNRYGLDKETKEMLNSLNNTMPMMEAIMEAVEKQQIDNEGLIQWQNLIKNAAYEAEDVLDDFEAKIICEDLKGKGKVRKAASSIDKGFKNLIFPNSGDVKDVKKLKAVVENLEQLGKQCSTFVGLINLDQNGQPSTNSRESTQILPYGQRLFGRDSEINLILTILGYDRESLEGEVISEGDEDSVRAMSFVGIISKIPFMVRKKFTESFGKPVGEMGAASSQESATGAVATSSLASQRGKDSVPSEMSSDRGKLTSLDSGLTLGVKNSDPISNQDKDQKLLPELNPVKYIGPHGKPFVIPIVGISGVGKTALALKIYELLKGHFGISHWVYMAGKFDVTKIVQALSPSFDRNVDPYSLQNEIITTIVGKKIFLVFDDVAGEECSQLMDLLTWFNIGGYGSVILITTQDHKVAKTVKYVKPIILEPIQWDYFLPLLEYYTFRYADVTNEKKNALMPILENIGKKLYGLPLAAKNIGALLRLKLDDINEWIEISQSNLWGQNDIASVLKISYKHLDANLKQCFAYCSIFPRNAIIERDRLIQMWIANGFIQPSSNNYYTRLEVIGNNIFDDLVGRSFFLPTPWPQMYIMHSAVRELAIAISSGEGFVIDDNLYPCLYGCSLFNEHLDSCLHGYFLHDNDSIDIPPNTRYLTVRRNKPCQDLIGRCAKELRTLLFQGINPPDKDSVKVLTKLRALELSCPNGVQQAAYMRTICGHLSHLRFLDLSYTRITKLPESICNLCHLQVLDIRGCMFWRLPEKMNHLINLRHLYASKETVFLINGIGKLTKLQELEEFRITEKEGHTINELADMKEIGGHLSLVGLRNVKDKVDALSAKLEEKVHLKALSLNWKSDKDLGYRKKDNVRAYNILCSLKSHQGLEKLEIKNFPCNKLSPAFSPLDIRHIYLENCFLLENVPPFGELCHLETLVLKKVGLKHIGEEFYGTGPEIFPALKVLKFIEMTDWKVWSIPSGNRKLIPILEELEIQDCSNLEKTPLNSLDLSFLKKLVLSNCVGILLEGTINDKPLPLLNSLYVSGNQSAITLSYENFSNLRVLSLENLCVRFNGNSQSLSYLKRLILSYAKIKWNREPIFPELIELRYLPGVI